MSMLLMLVQRFYEIFTRVEKMKSLRQYDRFVG